MFKQILKNIVLVIIAIVCINLNVLAVNSNDNIMVLGTNNQDIVIDYSSDLIFNNNLLRHNMECNSVITIYNTSSEDRDLGLISIQNNTDNCPIYTVAQLEILQGTKVVYKGGYGDKVSPLIEPIKIPAKGKVELKVKAFASGLEEDENWGELNTTWVFECGEYESVNQSTIDNVEYTVHCIDDNNSELKYESLECIAGQKTKIYAPEIMGYTPEYKFKEVEVNSYGAGIVFKYHKDIVEETENVESLPVDKNIETMGSIEHNTPEPSPLVEYTETVENEHETVENVPDSYNIKLVLTIIIISMSLAFIAFYVIAIIYIRKIRRINNDKSI